LQQTLAGYRPVPPGNRKPTMVVATLLHHACSSNPYATPEDTYKQTVQTFDNPILTALIESWLVSGELVLSE
jgi:major membrane immunogen (membrane-anchored lipoprotein)